MEFIQLLAVVYGSLVALCVTFVLTSRSAIFRPMVEGFVGCVQIALNMFNNNTYKVGNMEMEAIPSRKANHDRLSQEIEEAGNKMWAAWEARKAQVAAAISAIKGWFVAKKEAFFNMLASIVGWVVDRAAGVVIWWDAKIEAGKAKIEDIKMWWTGLFVQEDNSDEEIIDAVYVSEFSWLQRLLGIDKICARMDRVEERLEAIEADTLQLHQIRDLAELSVELQAAKIADAEMPSNEVNEAVELESDIVEEDNLTEVKKVTHDGAVMLLTVQFIEGLAWKDLCHLAVMYGILKGRRGMPNRNEMIMLVGQAVAERGDIGCDAGVVAYSMTA